jgi:hypothetical protein
VAIEVLRVTVVAVAGEKSMATHYSTVENSFEGKKKHRSAPNPVMVFASKHD